MSLWAWIKTHRKKIFLSAGLPFVLAVVAGIFYAEHKLSNLALGGLGESFSTPIFGAPTTVFVESRHSSEELINRLGRLQYRSLNDDILEPGTYFSNPPALSIFLKGFESPIGSQQAMQVRLKFNEQGVTFIENETTHQALDSFTIEPELVAELSGEERLRRDPAQWEEIPDLLVKAVVSAEDKRFFRHWGIDPLAMGRAFWRNLKHRGPLQGGSTITQQLAKNLLLTSRRTLGRKILDIGFAVYLDFRLGKEKILTLYLNHIYMGQDGPMSVAGVKAAAHFYFGKSLQDLSLPECATLAGLIRSPYRYNPITNFDNSLARRNAVLERMAINEVIDAIQAQEAQQTPLIANRTSTSALKENDVDYYVAEVIRQLLPIYEDEGLFRSGLKIYTSLDPLIQKSAQQALKSLKTQGAAVVMEPVSGRVLALAGGKNFRESQFNRATQAQRQPGSSFKLFLMGAALEKGFTPATFLHDDPRHYKDSTGKTWSPKNADGVYLGTVTARQMIAQSRNSAALDLAEQVGPESVAEFAARCGIKSPLEKTLGLALGASEVNLLELTAAYAAVANAGFTVTPLIITAVTDAEEHVLELHQIERHKEIEPSIAYVLTNLLQSVVQEGTARSLKDLGWAAPTAGKTGTTNGGRDAWFLGFTPELMAGVWVGDDDAKAVNLAGSKNALPVWAQLMKNADRGLKPINFSKPDDVITVSLDPQSGFLSRSGCPDKKDEIFISGTQPKTACPLHAGGLKGWWRKLFGGT